MAEQYQNAINEQHAAGQHAADQMLKIITMGGDERREHYRNLSIEQLDELHHASNLAHQFAEGVVSAAQNVRYEIGAHLRAAANHIDPLTSETSDAGVMDR